MKSCTWQAACAAVLALTTIGAAKADGPAVSALNAKLSGEAGAIGSQGSSSALGVVQGAVTTPLGSSFGLQIDGAGATAYGGFFGGGAAHLFWRDPAIGMVGPIAALSGGSGLRVGWYGAEAELYAGLVTLGVQGGWQDVTSSVPTSVGSGGFFAGHLTLYPIPDLALTIEGRGQAGRYIGRGTIEHQLQFASLHNVSLYVDAAAGDASFYRATAGLRIYLGTDKTLIRRHREDDPPELPMALAGPVGLGTPGVPGAASPGAGGGGGGFAGNNGGTSSGSSGSISSGFSSSGSGVIFSSGGGGSGSTSGIFTNCCVAGGTLIHH